MSYTDGAGLDGLQQAVDRLAARLGRSVAIDDAQGRLVVSSGHFGEEDDLRVFAIVNRYSDPRVMAHFREHGIYGWTEPGRVPANDEMGFKARVCCPIRDHGILFGHLFLIDDGVREDEVEQAVAVTDQIGQLMYRRLRVHEEAQEREAALVRGLTSADPDERTRARTRLHEDDHPLATTPLAALAVAVTEASSDDIAADLQTAVEAATGHRPASSLSWVRTSEAVVLVHGGLRDYPLHVAERVVSRLTAAGHRAVCGIGGTVDGVDTVPATCADARMAARAARLLPDLGEVVAADDLGVYRLLLSLPPGELSADRLPPGLRALVAADTHDALVETLGVYLDRGGDATAAAAALHVHRSTFYYRLGRIEEIVGVDLRDGQQRLWLHVGLKMLDLLPRP